MHLSSIQFLVIGFFLVLYGMVVPFMMLLDVLKPNFFWAFTSYSASFVGVLFGIIGVAAYVRHHKKQDK